jgi:hypothetical protein
MAARKTGVVQDMRKHRTLGAAVQFAKTLVSHESVTGGPPGRP